MTVPLDGDNPTRTIHLHLLRQGMSIIADRCLVEGIYRIQRLGLREEEGRWYLEMQSVQKDHRWWRLDGVDNGRRYCSEVRPPISPSEHT